MVLFCDVVGFTSMSKEVEPSEVMHFLNELYETFDKLVDEYDMYKLGACSAPAAWSQIYLAACMQYVSRTHVWHG